MGDKKSEVDKTLRLLIALETWKGGVWRRLHSSIKSYWICLCDKKDVEEENSGGKGLRAYPA